MVTREAAQAVLDNLFPIQTQVDHALSIWLARHRGRAYKVVPNSFLFFSPTSEEAGDSDIQTMKSLDAVYNL